MRGLLASVVTLTLSALPASAGAPAAVPVLDVWDVAYLNGGRAGYAHTITVPVERDGQKLLQTTLELRLAVNRFGDTVQLGMDTGTVETDDGKVTGVFMRQYLGKTKKLEVVGTVQGRQVELVLDGAGRLKPAPWDDRVVGLYKQQTLFKDRRVKPGDKFDYPSFEPSINLVLKNSVEVKDFEDVPMLPGKGKRHLLRVESRPQRIEKVQLPSLVAWLDDDLMQARAEVEVPGLGKIYLYRVPRAVATNTAGPVAQLTDIGLTQLIRLPAPIPRPYDTNSAIYRVKIKDDDDPATAFAEDARQHVKNVKGHTLELHVNSARGPRPEESVEAPGAEFLQGSYFIASGDARVKDLARQAVGGEKDDWRKALRIEKWVHTRMTPRNHEALATADHVARTLEGDCTEYAMLTAAMCRAEGVPSRTAVGLIYADVKGRPAFAFHMWTEVWARGQWLPLDATLGRGGIGATHLKISSQSWHDTRTMTPLFPVVRVLGRVSIDVIEVE